MPTYDELLAVDWPNEFIVEYVSGEQERLLRGKGVFIIPPDDDPNGCGELIADLPKKNPRHQKRGGRCIQFSELRSILSVDGRMLWPDV